MQPKKKGTGIKRRKLGDISKIARIDVGKEHF
jgi:hypothetical protein